jgi:tetratricopeptide (TPR) repeat protein
MTAQPEPKTQELEDKINSFMIQYRRPNDFEIRSLKRDVDNLKDKINYADYYDLLGRIAGLENNKDEMIYCFENAIKLSPNDLIIRNNYGISLENKGLVDLAKEQIEKTLNLFPDNIESLEIFVDVLSQSCRFNEALYLLNSMENKEAFPKYELINKAFDIFKKAQLSDDDAQHLQELAYGVIEKHNLYYFECQNRVSEDGVTFTLYVDLPVEKIFDINWDLAGILADNVEDMRCGVLNFKYSSIDVLRERKQYERII